MIARRVALLEQVSVASPADLSHKGVPENLEALVAHCAVNYISSATGRAVPLEFTRNDHIEAIELQATVSVTGVEMYTQAVLAGLGIVQVPRYHVEDALSDGRLQLVLPHLAPPAMPVSVLYPHSRQLSARVRVFADWLSEIFARHNVRR